MTDDTERAALARVARRTLESWAEARAFARLDRGDHLWAAEKMTRIADDCDEAGSMDDLAQSLREAASEHRRLAGE